MTRARLFSFVAMVAVMAPNVAAAQLSRFSGSLGLNVPIGELDKQGQLGFGVAIHTGFSDPAAVWTARSSFSFDRFSGKRASGIDSYQYLGLFGGDIVHNTNRQTYQYVGVGWYQVKTSFAPDPLSSPTIGVSGGQTSSEGDPGFQGGVGLNFGRSKRTYVEIGVVDVLTSGKSSVWFPLRFGIRL